MFLLYNVGLFLAFIFVYYFFEFSDSYLGKEIEPPDRINDIKFKAYAAETDRLVLVVIDALRYDFVTEKNMPFTYKMANETGCIFTVKTHMPTVTLPRIKSLTVGNIPQFADIILNFADTDSIKDSFLHRADEKGLKQVFYGDDTWLRLFPHIFNRSKGVSSFYVNDFYEVDSNVTKNMRLEMGNTDWNILILHYLGLDHIGHVYGPFSKLIQPKLIEMDNVIKEIYDSWKNTNTMILITGDHGMKDSGGHGGSTYEEITVPLVFIGAKCTGKKIDQTDIPVTLSYLLSTKLPTLSTGKLITTFKNFNYEKMLFMLRYNILHFNTISQNSNLENIFEEATYLHYSYLKDDNISHAAKAKVLYELYLNEISHDLTQDNDFMKEYALIFVVAVLPIICSLNMYTFGLKCRDCVILNGFEHFFIAFLTIVQPILMFSSSFIESENDIWYYYGSTLFLLLANSLYKIKKFKRLLFATLLSSSFLLLRNYIVDNPFIEFHKFSYVIFIFLSIYSVLKFQFIYSNRIAWYVFLTLLGNCLFHICRLAIIAKVCWCLFIFFAIVVFCKRSYDLLVVFWVLLSSLLLNSNNLVIVLFALLCSSFTWKLVTGKNVFLAIIGNFWLGKILHYLQGNGNSISDIDITPGYIGLEQYQPVLVGLQIFIHMYIFPILCLLLSIRNVRVRTNDKRFVDLIFALYFAFRLYSLAMSLICCYIHKQHLFIWSVFSPKLLMELLHSLALYIVYFVYKSVCLLQRLCTSSNKIFIS